MSKNIPSNPTDLKAIRVAFDQISDELSKIQTGKTQVNEILAALEEKYDLPKKTFRRVAYLYYRQNVKEFENEASEINDLYKAVIG